MSERTIPVCFPRDQYRLLVEFAKKNGMVNTSQAVEKLIDEA